MPRLDDIIADILPEVQNAPADTLKKALREAARTLCRRSKVWRADVEGTLLPGIAQVELELPRDAALVDVACLYRPGQGPQGGGFPSRTGQLFGDAFRLGADGALALAEAPSEGGTLRAVVSLAPTPQAERLDDALYDAWGAAIRHGARWLLKSMHGREWFEAQVALYHQQEFERGIAQAAHAALRACEQSRPAALRNRFL
jgi:hypothetical protein